MRLFLTVGLALVPALAIADARSDALTAWAEMVGEAAVAQDKHDAMHGQETSCESTIQDWLDAGGDQATADFWEGSIEAIVEDVGSHGDSGDEWMLAAQAKRTEGNDWFNDADAGVSPPDVDEWFNNAEDCYDDAATQYTWANGRYTSAKGELIVLEANIRTRINELEEEN